MHRPMFCDDCRRLRFCEFLTLALDPLELGYVKPHIPTLTRYPLAARPRDRANALRGEYSKLNGLRELALCLAASYSMETFLSPAAWRVAEQPWVCALLSAPRQLRLLSLEIDFACFLPPLTNLRHLLLFVRRAVAQQAYWRGSRVLPHCWMPLRMRPIITTRACTQVWGAIASLHGLETLSITGSQVICEKSLDPRRATLLPPLDLRQDVCLRAAAFTDAVPAALRLPANGCRCSVAADAQTLHDVRSADGWRYDACFVSTDEQVVLETGFLARLLAARRSGLTVLKVGSLWATTSCPRCGSCTSPAACASMSASPGRCGSPPCPSAPAGCMTLMLTASMSWPRSSSGATCNS